MDHCDACGFRYDEVDPDSAAARLRVEAVRVAELLGAPAEVLARRPEPSTWSALEYACHVRDVLLVQRERVLLARREVHPQVVPMGRDERVEHDGYDTQRPGDVARQLLDAAAMLAHVLDRLDADGWARTLGYQYPEPATRTVEWLASHTVHELVHHGGDVERAIGAVR
jgi:hypothetical protein